MSAFTGLRGFGDARTVVRPPGVTNWYTTGGSLGSQRGRGGPSGSKARGSSEAFSIWRASERQLESRAEE